jgi:hypothetical protein
MTEFVKYDSPENKSGDDFSSISNHRLVIIDNLENGTSTVVKNFYPEPNFIIEDGTKIRELWYEDILPLAPNRERSYQSEFNQNIKQGAVRFHRIVTPPLSKVKTLASKYSFSSSKETFTSYCTTSIDFVAVLKAEIDIATQNGRVRINEGDTFIQKATFQGFINPGKIPAEMVFAMIGTNAFSASRQAKPLNVPFSIQLNYPKECKYGNNKRILSSEIWHL